MKKIAVVGSFVMDQIAIVKAFPEPGQTIIGEDFKSFPGGKGANQAVGAARLGGHVQMFGKVGQDENGSIFLDLFNREGIDVSAVKRDEKRPTALGLIQINQEAENKIVVIPGANYGYDFEDLDQDIESILQSDLVVAQLELRIDVTYELIKRCGQHGVPVVLNPAPAVPVPAEILKHVTYLTPNETELEILADMKITDEASLNEAVQKLLGHGVKNIVATLGKNGALIANSEGVQMISGYKVDAVDTVAAGDSFNGALAKSVVEGLSLHDAVKYANAVGAITVTGEGAIPSLPTAGTVDAFIKNNG